MALVSIIERGVWEPLQTPPCLAMECVSPFSSSTFSHSHDAIGAFLEG